MDEPLELARRLWRQGELAQARSVVSEALAHVGSNAKLKFAAWAYGEAFLAPIVGRHVTLVRRSPADLELVRGAWADQSFMDRFHRLAPPLPASDAALEAILSGEATSTLLDNNNLHWTITTASNEKRIGMASLTDISVRHGRAEFIIGVRGAAPGLALEASLLMLEFAFRTLRLRKLHSTVYGGNEYAQRSTRHLGFELEGRLRQHVQDPRTRECLDLCLFGLFPQEFFSAANQRLAARLLGRPLSAATALRT